MKAILNIGIEILAELFRASVDVLSIGGQAQ